MKFNAGVVILYELGVKEWLRFSFWQGFRLEICGRMDWTFCTYTLFDCRL